MSRLLELLKDGQFHSGQVLGEILGVSRSAVWKRLKQLELELGLSVHKVPGRGYRLAAPILSLCEVDGAGWPVHVLDTVDSTNAEALRLIERGVVAPFVVVAERQVAGRGRRGRVWSSPYGQNLYYSAVLRIDGGMRQLEGLSLVVGLAVLRILRGLGIRQAGLKWPNDVLVQGRKIAGILLELVGDPADVCHVVVGVGINVNMVSVEGVDQQWSSVRLETGSDIDRNQLILALNEALQSYLKRFHALGFSSLQQEWDENHLWQGREVSLIAGGNVISGVVLGVDQRGALRLLVDGQEAVFSGGELSLRLRNDT